MVQYYNLHDGLALLARINPGEIYRVLNSKDRKWIDGRGMCERYFFNGEIGAELISQSDAEALALSLGETLTPIHKLAR